MKAVVAQFHGNPTLFIDDKPVTGLMSWNRYPSREDTALFRDAGLEFFSIMGDLFIPHNGISDEALATEDGSDGSLGKMQLTHENIDRTMEMLLEVNPKLKILPRIILNAPNWWLRENPEETLIVWNVQAQCYETQPRPAFGSPSWQKFWVPALADTVNYFEDHWGEHIFGYHPGMGHCGEHTYAWCDRIGDFSSVQKHDFHLWLKKKYGTIGNLNAAWKKQYTDFDSLPLPDAEQLCRSTIQTKSLYLPETELDLIDFLHFSSDRIADTILLEAKTIKDTLKRRRSEKICGVFYGYSVFGSNSVRCTAGHNALARVLESPDIDFICGPLSYAARQNGGTVMPQIVPGSIRCHGKLFYNEEDSRTNVMQHIHHWHLPASAEDTVNIQRRNFLETWSTGGTQWWMDLYGEGWFLDPKIKQEVTLLRKFAGRHLADRESMAEIAVFISQESADFVRDNPAPLTCWLIEQQLMELCACGAPHDLYLLTDLPLLAKQGKLKQYKMCVFLNCIAVEKDIVECMGQELKRDNRTLLWFYTPGYIRDNRRDAAYSEELTGIHFEAVESGIHPMITEFWLDGHRFSYGLPNAVYPHLTADDPKAEVLGYWVNGSRVFGQEHGFGAALVSRRFPNFRSIWSASPGMPSALLSQFASEAGVHLYSTRGDQIFCAPNWIGIHAKSTGPLELHLPVARAYINAVTGKEYPEADVLILQTQRGETLLLEEKQTEESK